MNFLDFLIKTIFSLSMFVLISFHFCCIFTCTRLSLSLICSSFCCIFFNFFILLHIFSNLFFLIIVPLLLVVDLNVFSISFSNNLYKSFNIADIAFNFVNLIHFLLFSFALLRLLYFFN